MKFLTITSPEYTELHKLMTESVSKYSRKLMVEHFENPQFSDFGTPEFNSAMRFKAEMIVKHLTNMRDGEILLYSDSDVIFRAHPYIFVKLSSENDFTAQNDLNDDFCAGFFAAKKSDEMIRLWREISEKVSEIENDQEVLNRIIVKSKLKTAMFGDGDVCSYGIISRGEIWKGQEFKMPRCKAFHANYTVGIENKKRLMKMAIGQ